jgi:hypothetical protein
MYLQLSFYRKMPDLLSVGGYAGPALVERKFWSTESILNDPAKIDEICLIFW